MSHIAHKKTRLTLTQIASNSYLNEDGCWIWQGRVDPYGYAVYGKGFHVRVARYAWECKNIREMQDGLLACHICNNKVCVNPDHIYEGTFSSNLRDQYRAGRRQQRKTQSLTNEQVSIIKVRIHESRRSLAREYGVSHATINKIMNGERYIDVEPNLKLAQKAQMETLK